MRNLKSLWERTTAAVASAFRSDPPNIDWGPSFDEHPDVVELMRRKELAVPETDKLSSMLEERQRLWSGLDGALNNGRTVIHEIRVRRGWDSAPNSEP
jgi:hypothetical protein